MNNGLEFAYLRGGVEAMSIGEAFFRGARVFISLLIQAERARSSGASCGRSFVRFDTGF